MKNISFKIVIWKEEEYFVAQCLDFDISSFGRTQNEAFINLQEAVDLYLDDDTRDVIVPESFHPLIL